MARKLERLTPKKVAGKLAPGYYGDGGNLYLQVSEAGTKSWIFRYTVGGRTTDMGLGALHTFGLADARARAQACRQLLADGVDPRQARDQAKLAKLAERRKQDRIKTFSECVKAYLKAHREEWKNAKHASQWQTTLDEIAGPIIGKMSVADIDTADVLRVLEPIWETKNTTAVRLRARIESVLAWAKVHKYRDGDNPASWRGNLKEALAKPSKVYQTEHHAALDYRQMAEFMADLRQRQGLAARALELTILCATRTIETLGARWSEVDFEEGVWTVSASRLKVKNRPDHRIPLSETAIKLLQGLPRTGEYVFPGRSKNQHLNIDSMRYELERMGRNDLTVHGFRSTFSTWAADTTNHDRQVREVALAHSVLGVEGDYMRGELLEKRRRLMADWAQHCDGIEKEAKVTPIRKKKA